MLLIKSKFTMPREQGFTIIELMIVLAVLAVLSAVAIPNFSEMIANNRISTNTNTFIGAFSYARSEAVGRGSSVRVSSLTGTSAWDSGLRVWQDTDDDGTYDAGEELRQISGFTLNTITGTRSDFVFASTGQVDNADIFEVCDSRTGETGRTITLLGGGGMTVSNSSSCL
jgi:type IV fimbrial biogenesis protein FimT